ncbi:heterokaryon incompatibility, partial [Schizothecium vesticola]
ISRARYEALSYCWGDDACPETISLHHTISMQIPITHSLAEALADLRLPSSDRLLWADALCINQADNGEKSIQVRQMYDVYANSRRTLVYL